MCSLRKRKVATISLLRNINYILQWAKREMVELLVLSYWKDKVESEAEERSSKLTKISEQPIARALQNSM